LDAMLETFDDQMTCFSPFNTTRFPVGDFQNNGITLDQDL